MRHRLLGHVLIAFACSACARSPSPLVSVATIRSDLTREQQVDHALSRLTYGARPGDAHRVRAMGLERWIALQLSPERIDDRATDSVLALYQAMDTPTAELVATFRGVQAARRQQQRDSMRPMLQPGQSIGATPPRNPRLDLQLALGQVQASRLLRAVV